MTTKLTYGIKNSIGNAKEAGMAKDLELTSSDYSLAVSIFFVGYLLLEVPSNMILSRTRPSLYLPALMVRSLH
jgi:fucose permease